MVGGDLEGGHGQSGHISWHPGFAQGLKAEFAEYGDALRFETETQLTKEALRVDVVVILKDKGVRIEKNIGRIFRGHNIFEYKPHSDYVSVLEFKKVYAYAWLYASAYAVDMDDITLTFAVTNYPEDLINYCGDKLNWPVSGESKGIYRIYNGFMPMQIVECKKLDESENIWLSSLRNGLSFARMERIAKAANTKDLRDGLNAYFDVLFSANANVLREAKGKMTQELRKVLIETGLAAEWQQEATARADAKWQNVLADKDAVIADMSAENARLRSLLEGKA